MSHEQQMAFCQSIKERFPGYFDSKFVLDIGSLDVNGSNFKLFVNCIYLGIDIAEGRNVDLVCKAHELNLPDESIDTIISTECFEHDRYYKESLTNIVRLLKPGGLFLFSCATTGRPEHGTQRTTLADAPLLAEFGDWADYYKNLTENDIEEAIDVKSTFSQFEFSVEHHACDLYFFGIKKGEFQQRNDYSISPFRHHHPLIENQNLREKIAQLKRKIAKLEGQE